MSTMRARVGLSATARLALWGTIGALLLLPAIAMHFTNEVAWTGSDFVAMGLLLGGAGLACELLALFNQSVAYRLGAGLAVLGAVLLIWVDLAVGIIGRSFEPANLLFAAVLAIGAAYAAATRFQPKGMAHAMLTMVTALIIAVGIAFIIVAASEAPAWRYAMLALTGGLATIWLAAAALFARSARA